MFNLFKSLFFGAIIFISCEKEIPYGHPKCDTCSWDVLICKINGEPWQAKINCEFLGNCDPIDCQYYPESGGLDIHGKNDILSSGIKMYLRDQKINVGGHFPLYNQLGGYVCSGCNPKISFSNLDSTKYNMLKILSLDTVRKIIEGSFDFTVLNIETNRSIKLTDGYFKLTYRP